MQVHSGIVPAEKRPELVCQFKHKYNKQWGNEPRSFRIGFYDLQREKLIFLASCDYVMSAHFYKNEFARILREIETRFFPEKKP